MTHPKEVIDCIEAICQLGCNTVRKKIVALENQQQIDEIVLLQAKDREAVLQELKCIMSIYDDQ